MTKFKVGDKVRIKGTALECVVTHTNCYRSDAIGVDIPKLNGNSYGGNTFLESALELTPPEMIKIEKGDRVQMITQSDGPFTVMSSAGFECEVSKIVSLERPEPIKYRTLVHNGVRVAH